jgi:hypothetical protein
VSRRSRKPDDEEHPVRLTGAFGRLEDAFREAGMKQDQERKLQEQRAGGGQPARGGLGRRWLGPAIGALTAFGVVGAGVAISTDFFTADGGSAGSGSKPPVETRHAPGDAYRGHAVAGDPERSTVRWGVGVYPSRHDRRTCVVAGRVRGQGLGVEQGGRFTGLSRDFPGYCDFVDGRHTIFTTRSYFKATGDRTLLYGYADRTVKSMRLGLPGALRELDIASDGTFIIVAAGPNALRGQQLVIVGTTGTERYTLQPGH